MKSGQLGELARSRAMGLVLGIALVSVLAVIGSIHRATSGLVALSDSHQWQQPASISERYPQPISNNTWQFDFEVSEQSLLGIKHSKQGELVLNEQAAAILEQAVSPLPADLNDVELQRIELLIAKGFSQQLAKVVTGYYRYHHATKQIKLAESTQPQALPNSLDEQERRFRQSVLWQVEFLGEAVANTLFGRQNALNQYLYDRRHINADSSLSSAQKQQQLNALKDRFKANGY